MPQSFSTHGKWFVDPSEPFPVNGGFMFNPVSLGMVGGVGAVVAVWVVLTRRVGLPDLPGNRWFVRLQPALPRLVAAALGITLTASWCRSCPCDMSRAAGSSPSSRGSLAFGWLLVSVCDRLPARWACWPSSGCCFRDRSPSWKPATCGASPGSCGWRVRVSGLGSDGSLTADCAGDCWCCVWV